MIHKSVRLFKRNSDGHTEKVCRQTWWLLGIIPVYTSDYILHHNL